MGWPHRSPSTRWPNGTPAPLTAAADPVLDSPPGAAVPTHQEPTAALGPLPTPAACVRDDGWPGNGPGAFVDGWAHSSAAAAHDAPAPRPGAAAPAAAALPGDVALEHGNRLSNGKQGGADRFGSIDQLGGDDESWGHWSFEPVLCGVPPTEWDDGYGYSDAATAGWGSAAPTGSADGHLDGDGLPQAAWYGTGGGRGGGPSYSAPGRQRWKAQSARWASATYRRSPSGEVRVADVQRANTVPERWVAAGPPARSAAPVTGDGVRIAFDRSLPPSPPPPLSEVQQNGFSAPHEVALEVARVPSSFAGHPIGKRVNRLRLPQGQPPYFHPSKWVVLEGGWGDTGGPVIHLSFGRVRPEVAFGPAWGLGWMLPPGGWGLDRFLMHVLRWGHLAASALTPMGQGGLADYTLTVSVPTLEQIIRRFLVAGFSKRNLADGGGSYLGAWSMDCAWHALRQWHGIARRRTRMGALGNENHLKAATQMASARGVELSYWTRDLEHVCTADKAGNITETYATLLVKDAT